jgi:DNA modification methylase
MAKSREAPSVRVRADLAVPKVAVFRIEELEADEGNPRIISEASLDGLKNSVARFGCVEPIVVNVRGRRKKVVGGHQRLAVLKRLGVKKVLCVTVDCAPAEEKLLNLTLNNPEIQGRFVKDLDAYITRLRDQLGDAALLASLRIDALYAGIAKPSEKAGNVPDDDLPAKPKKAVTKPGDLWLLGDHRLLCGDSTNPEDVGRLMGQVRAKLFATDPPYCVDYTGKDRPKSRGKDWSDEYNETDIKDLEQFLVQVYTIGLAVVSPHAAMYLWHADKRRSVIQKVAESLGIIIHQQLIWVKPCMVFGYSFYAWRHEPCVLMWRKGSKPEIDKEKRTLTNAVTTVWPVGLQRTGDPTTPAYYSDVWELDYDGKRHRSGPHPTMKPVEVFAIPMRIHTQPGDVCYEPFSGSGTQIIAAEKLGRRCFSLEKQPFFVDVAVRRWEEWTGKKAVLAPKGRRGR